MSQLRMGVILGGVVLALAAVSAPAYAQGPQRGNRGGPGGGGPGGFRGGFGRGGSLVDLADREAVQKEIQVTEEQKPQIEQLARDSRSRRDRTMQQLRERNDRAQSQVRDARPNIPQVAPNAGNAGGGFGAGYGGEFGGYGTSPYGNVPDEGPSPAQLQQMAEMQQRQQERMVRTQGFEQMRQAMEGLNRQTDQSLAKILKKEQMTRLRQIQLQMEGPFAVLSNAELNQLLQITPEQDARLRDVQARDREMRGQLGQERRAIFESIRNTMQANAPGDQQPNAQDGGRGGRGNFDREAFREVMRKPEVQAQMDKIQKQEDTLRDRAYAGVFKELDRRQSSTYRKLLGEPFDTSALMRGFFTGGRSNDEQAENQTPEEAEDAAAARDKALVDDADEDDAPAAKEEATPAPAATAAPAPAPAPAAGNRPTSLRERRGLGASRP